MVCALCKQREANKKNTHFLTDAIIRTCLNLDGSNKREQGYYFEFSNDNPFLDFNFQRETSIDKLITSFKRNISDKEIEKAKSNPYSVDNVFCSTCESYFTDIENKFINNYLSRFRNTDLTNKDTIMLNDTKAIRLFFYIQIWRTAICDNILKISKATSENLRQIILNYKSVDAIELKHYPLAITYLQTVGEKDEYTSNYIGYTDDRNPNLIIMNDFVIQFYESYDDIQYFDFYGLTTEQDYKHFINYNEKQFLVKIIQNDRRKQFLKDFITHEKANTFVQHCSYLFEHLWIYLFGVRPSVQITQEYLQVLTGNEEFNILTYSKENVVKVTADFVFRKFNQSVK